MFHDLDYLSTYGIDAWWEPDRAQAERALAIVRELRGPHHRSLTVAAQLRRHYGAATVREFRMALRATKGDESSPREVAHSCRRSGHERPQEPARVFLSRSARKNRDENHRGCHYRSLTVAAQLRG